LVFGYVFFIQIIKVLYSKHTRQGYNKETMKPESETASHERNGAENALVLAIHILAHQRDIRHNGCDPIVDTRQ
jgi:hypothetical protein